MANSLEFKISADDQASRVVETVQNKITNFGKDIAKMALGFAGPLALVQMGFQKIGEMMDEQKKRREELAQSITADPIYQQITAQTEYNSTLSETERALLAQKAAQDELTKTLQTDAAKRRQYTEDFLKTPAGQKIVSASIAPGSEAMPITDAYISMLASIKSYQDIALESQKAQTNALLETLKLKDRERALDKSRNDSANEFSNSIKGILQTQIGISGQGRTQQLAAQNLAQAQEKLDALRAKRMEKSGITVSSLREMGGGISGESAAIRGQISEPLGKSQQEIVAEQLVEMARIDNESVQTFKTSVMDFKSIMTSMPTVTQQITPFVNPSPTANTGN
jgi:hypothetical protein